MPFGKENCDTRKKPHYDTVHEKMTKTMVLGEKMIRKLWGKKKRKEIHCCTRKNKGYDISFLPLSLFYLLSFHSEEKKKSGGKESEGGSQMEKWDKEMKRKKQHDADNKMERRQMQSNMEKVLYQEIN